MAVVRCELRPQLGEIQNRIDLAQKVIGGDALFEIKPVEKPTLRSRTLSHHRRLHRFALNQWNHASLRRPTPEFFNKIRHELPESQKQVRAEVRARIGRQLVRLWIVKSTSRSLIAWSVWVYAGTTQGGRWI